MNTTDGLCECGCGGLAPLAKITNSKWGHVKGRPVRFITGHNARGKIVSDEQKLKISIANKGNKHTEETKRKISLINKGRKHTSETIKKMSEIKKGKVFTQEHKDKIGQAHKGKKLSEEQRLAMSFRVRGSKHPKWKGGVTPINQQIRNSFEYDEWRNAVY